MTIVLSGMPVLEKCLFICTPIIISRWLVTIRTYITFRCCHMMPLQPPQTTYSTPGELDTLAQAREANRQQAKVNYHIVGMFGGDKVWRIASSKVVGKKKFGECLQLIIIIIMKWTDEWKSLNDLSLANALLFAKFAKLSPCQIFPLYGTPPCGILHVCDRNNVGILLWFWFLYIEKVKWSSKNEILMCQHREVSQNQGDIQ